MRKKRTGKRQPTAEERSRTADYRLKRYISKSAVDWAEQDQEIRRQMIFQTFGYKLPDPVEKSKSELVAEIDKLAIRMIDEDAKLARRVALARVRQVLGETGLTFTDDEWQKKPPTIKEMTEKFREVNDLKEVLGAKKPGLLDALTDPKVISALISVLSQAFGGKQLPTTNGTLILVGKDGKETPITRQELEKLEAKGNTKSPGKLEGAGPTNQSKDTEAKSELDKPDKAKGDDGETGTIGSGD